MQINPFTHLNFDQTQQKRLEPLSRVPFSQLIEKQSEKGLPFILGIDIDPQNPFNLEMDGVRMHKLYKAEGTNSYTGQKVKDIYYYTIAKGQNELTYLGKTSSDGPFLDEFFKAYEGQFGDYYLEKKNYPEALFYFQKLAATGSKEGIEKFINLALNMGDDAYLKKNFTDASSYYLLALNSAYDIPNDRLMKVYNCLGDFYNKNNEYSKALYYYKILANNGSKEGARKYVKLILSIGDQYYKRKDSHNALLYYKLALNYGVPSNRLIEIYTCIARIYYYGDGVEKNFSEARKYYAHAAHAGCVNSQIITANLYEKDTSNKDNLKIAMKYYRLAADQDHPESILSLAFLTSTINNNIKESTLLVNKFVDLGFVKKFNYGYLIPWINLLKKNASDSGYALALSRLQNECDIHRLDQVPRKALNDITNSSNTIGLYPNQKVFVPKRKGVK